MQRLISGSWKKHILWKTLSAMSCVGAAISLRTTENGTSVPRPRGIDFTANMGDRRYYIQSAFALPGSEKRQQETAPLVAVSDSFRKIIITRQENRLYMDESGILTINLFDFLLGAQVLISA